MDGFIAAMNPSLGLIGCCDRRKGESMNRITNRGKFHGMQNVFADNISSFGVGVGFLQDKSGALFVTTLVPEGVGESSYIESVVATKKLLSCPV
jgi:hypothetical protein